MKRLAVSAVGFSACMALRPSYLVMLHAQAQAYGCGQASASAPRLRGFAASVQAQTQALPNQLWLAVSTLSTSSVSVRCREI